MLKSVEPKKEAAKEPVKTVAAPAAAKVEAVKAEPAKKAEPKAAAKKAPAKKPAAKKAAPKAAAKKAPAKKAAAKKPAAKKAPAEKTEEILVQSGRGEWSVADIKERVIAASGKRASAIKSLQIYVKPEEGVAYYVVNGKAEGSFIEL